MRDLATLQTIDNISPLEGAELLEVATVGVREIVVPRGMFEVGEQAFLFETGTFLPTDVYVFESLHTKGAVTVFNPFLDIEDTGHVLRAARFGERVSDGLLAPVVAFNLPDNPTQTAINEHMEALGVFEFEARSSSVDSGRG